MTITVKELWAKVDRLEEELAELRRQLESLSEKELAPEERLALWQERVRRENERMLPSMRSFLEQLGIPEDMKPIPAEQLQQMMIESGINPEDNLFSRAIIEMREEEELGSFDKTPLPPGDNQLHSRESSTVPRFGNYILITSRSEHRGTLSGDTPLTAPMLSSCAVRWTKPRNCEFWGMTSFWSARMHA